MNRNIQRLLKQNKRDLAVCRDKLELVASLSREGKEYEANELLQEIAALSNRIAIRQREMVMFCGNPSAQADVERIIAQTNRVEIGFTQEGWFVLRMEPLAKTKDAGSKEYIRGIIYPALRRYFADKPIVRYFNYTLIFRHVYDGEVPESQYRDYDNVEVKVVVDAVAMYTTTDDNPRCCRMFHCCAPGEGSRTEVYVVPQEDFAKWCKMEPDIPACGMPLTDKVPKKWAFDII